jgi:hypothetical protein
LAEEGKGTTNEELTPEEIFAPMKKRIDDKIAVLEKEFERVVNQINSLSDTKEGHVQKQIGQLYTLILDREAGLWTLISQLGRWFLDLSDYFNKRIDAEVSPEQLRTKLMQTVEEMFQSIEKSTKKPTNPIYS